MDMFTKMCEVEEVQGIWKPKTGDVVYSKIKDRIVVLYWSKHHGSPPSHYTDKKTAIWLLRQDQLIKEIRDFTKDNLKELFSNLIDFIRDCELEEESFEMILLRYLMYIKYGKTWDSEEVWVV